MESLHKFATLPALQRFVGLPSLLTELSTVSAEQSRDVSTKMRAAGAWRASSAAARLARVLWQVLPGEYST